MIKEDKKGRIRKEVVEFRDDPKISDYEYRKLVILDSISKQLTEIAKTLKGKDTSNTNITSI